MHKPKLIFLIGFGLLACLALQGFLAIQPSLAARPALADAPPVLPSGFWGTVKIDGENAPVGATVSAWINGVQYAYTTTQLYEATGETVYSLDVPGDQPETAGVIEGGKSGDTIIFKVNGASANESGSWQSGVNTEINLTLAKPTEYNIFIPVILK
jgi:hypothetical protein